MRPSKNIMLVAATLSLACLHHNRQAERRGPTARHDPDHRSARSQRRSRRDNAHAAPRGCCPSVELALGRWRAVLLQGSTRHQNRRHRHGTNRHFRQGRSLERDLAQPQIGRNGQLDQPARPRTAPRPSCCPTVTTRKRPSISAATPRPTAKARSIARRKSNSPSPPSSPRSCRTAIWCSKAIRKCASISNCAICRSRASCAPKTSAP